MRSILYYSGRVAVGSGWHRGAICWDQNQQPGRITIVDKDCSSKVVEWSTDQPAFSYCFLKSRDLIFSGHKTHILGWDLEGEQVCSLGEDNGVGKCVFSLCAHPSQDSILSGSNDLKIRVWDVSGYGDIEKPSKVIQVRQRHSKVHFRGQLILMFSNI